MAVIMSKTYNEVAETHDTFLLLPQKYFWADEKLYWQYQNTEQTMLTNITAATIGKGSETFLEKQRHNKWGGGTSQSN